MATNNSDTAITRPSTTVRGLPMLALPPATPSFKGLNIRLRAGSVVLLALLAACPGSAWAQFELDSGGRIGIATSPNSNNRLRVIAGTEDIAIFGRSADTGNFNNYGIRGEAANGYASFGLYAIASGAIANYGVYAVASLSSSYSRGIYVSAGGGSSNNYGIYATASGNGNLAGYFNGDILVAGNVVPSDARLKTQIGSLRGESILAQLLRLEPRRYRYLSEAELRNRDLPALHTREGDHFGLLAQELEQVFPELVTEVVHVLGEESGAIGEDAQTVTTKAVNYSELIPLLLAAMQEQQAQIDALTQALQANGIEVSNQR